MEHGFPTPEQVEAHNDEMARRTAEATAAGEAIGDHLRKLETDKLLAFLKYLEAQGLLEDIDEQGPYLIGQYLNGD